MWHFGIRQLSIPDDGGGPDHQFWMYIFSAPDHLYKVDSSSSNVVTGPGDNCFIKNKNAKYTNGSTNNLFFFQETISNVLSICAHKLYNIITPLTLLALESTLSRRSGATKVHMRKMDDLGRRCCQGLKIVLPQSVTQRRCLSQFQSLYHPPARVRTQYVEANLNKKLYSGQETTTAWKNIPYSSKSP